jgi:hypothetical protein
LSPTSQSACRWPAIVGRAANKVVAALPAQARPLAAGAGSLRSVRCTSEEGPCRLLRLDPHSLRVLARFRLPGVPAGSLAVGDDTVWLPDQSGRWVWRVDLVGALLRLDPAAV